jgi:hypothetical protein
MMTGCAYTAKVHYDVAEGVPTEPLSAAPADDDGEIVGIAISGGGSRASVYGAAAMEALWEHGLTDRADYLSSVSGGSIAGSYYVKKHLLDGEEVDAAFFQRFKEQMRYSFWGSISGRAVYKFRGLSATRRAESLSEALDKHFLDGVTLGELGDSLPHLLINAVLYDNGRAFVITTLDQDEIAYDFTGADGALGQLAEEPAISPLTFADESVLGSVPSELPLSLAVAASAALPFVIGPVSIQDGSTYWHLVDGGVFDNTGAANLVQVVLGQLARRDSPGKALILVLDSGMGPEDPEELTSIKNFHVYGHPQGVWTIPGRRADAYHELVWQALVEEHGEHAIEKIFMRYTEVELDPALLPESCLSIPVLCREEVCSDALQDHIRHIPTHLKISDCDADLIEILGHVVVHEALEDSHPMTRSCSLHE